MIKNRSRAGSGRRGRSREALEAALGHMQALLREHVEGSSDRIATLERTLTQARSLFDHGPIAQLAVDTDGLVVEANPAAAALLSDDRRRTVQNKPLLVFVYQPDVRRLYQHFANCKRDGHSRTELRLRRAHGEPHQVELVSVVVFSSALEKPVYQSVIHDLEMLAVRDRAIAESERRYREIVETANEGICIVDPHNDIVFANRRLSAMVGRPVEQLIGTSAYDLVQGEDRERMYQEFANQKAADDDVRLYCANGSVLWTSVSTSVIRDDRGRFAGMLRMYADATARHELAEAKQTLVKELIATQERERARIARELHDQMGQHIVALGLGIAKLARLAAPLEEAQPVLAQLRQIADLLGRDVHTLAFQLRPAALDHLGLGVALASYGEDAARRSGVEIDVHCDDLTDLQLNDATRTALYRIAQEAVTNAIKHARPQRISVILERRAAELLLIVEDDGRGMPQRLLDASAGSGVGLTGIRERVSLLGGTLSIESTGGQGTTVYARIPLPTSRQEGHDEQTPTAPGG